MKKFQAAVIAGLLATSALASANAASKAENYDKLVLKARVGYLNVSNKLKNGSSAANKSFKNGYMGEVAANYFFTPNIAVEGSIGYGRTG